MAGTVSADSVSSSTVFNAASYLVDRNLDAGRGNQVAVVGSRTILTYDDLSALHRRTGAALLQRGLRHDDRVMLLMSDDVEMFAAILGCFRAGLVAVPVSTMLTGPELGVILADSGARALIVTSEFGAAASEALTAASDLQLVVTVNGADVRAPGWAQTIGWDELLEGMEADSLAAATATSPDSWALWLYTSGTTGSPKAAMHRHANIRHVCETYGAQVLGITESDRCLSVAKLFFAYGIGNSMFFPLSVGATSLLEPRRPTPAVIGERAASDRPSLFFGVPTFFAALVASDLDDATFATVRLATSAGEALPAELQRRFTTRFGPAIIDGIGSTEALHIFVSNRPDDIRPGTTGTAVPGYQVELRDELGRLVPTGEPGVLYVRGESIALGYWHRTDATREVFQGEWMRTGDTYLQDADGYFVCLGRANDLLKAGGIWVSPAEVEARLLVHPAVAEVAVVGVADGDGLDKPVAFVVPRTGHEAITEDELILWCREGLAAFKRPRAVVFLAAIPKTATGKVQRFRMREQASARYKLAPLASATSAGAPS